MYNYESDQALDEIAAAIAHEVKNPISLVKANISILAQDKLAEAYENNFRMINRELDKINEIMMDFIHLTERNVNEPDIVYICDMLRELTADLYISGLNGLTINLNCPDENLAVLGCEKSLKILFRNILKNALEAMEYKGNINVDVSSKEQLLTVKIKDTGNGFPEDIKDKIFTEYFTTKSGGSGLGLSICKKIAKEHSGRFTLKNVTGGCEATVEMPIFSGE
ncbi:MAG: HAMP domain-containing histidine kinase [Clostridiales bacterium]|jgi:signal transduction histidine kinase|nr:HAMP domain-containing histidine kinase [Clostridiales bacterium]